jgi:hypothetical protein
MVIEQKLKDKNNSLQHSAERYILSEVPTCYGREDLCILAPFHYCIDYH